MLKKCEGKHSCEPYIEVYKHYLPPQTWTIPDGSNIVECESNSPAGTPCGYSDAGGTCYNGVTPPFEKEYGNCRTYHDLNSRECFWVCNDSNNNAVFMKIEPERKATDPVAGATCLPPFTKSVNGDCSCESPAVLVDGQCTCPAPNVLDPATGMCAVNCGVCLNPDSSGGTFSTIYQNPATCECNATVWDLDSNPTQLTWQPGVVPKIPQKDGDDDDSSSSSSSSTIELEAGIGLLAVGALLFLYRAFK